MSSNSSTLNVKLLRQLECPVCFETCLPPIFMCCNGHCVCAKCQAQLKECSTCRAPGKPALRCVQLEKIAELLERPCANHTHGCEHAFNTDEMAEHLPKCEHGYECLKCKTWKGQVKDLKYHISVAHKGENCILNLPLSGKSRLSWGRSEFKRDNSFTMFCTFNETPFWLNFKHTMPGRVFSATMRLISHSQAEASKFFFSLEFSCLTSKLKVLFQGDVLTLTEDATSDLTDFVIPAGIVDSYEDKPVSFSVSISKK